MENPFFYYRLDKFYNNYRSYVKSKDIYQISGAFKEAKDEKKCDSAKTNFELWGGTDAWIDKQDLSRTILNTPKNLAYPCGKIAKYMFDDEFINLSAVDKSFSVAINDTNIAHRVDVDHKFKVND